jgi:hypothetical protein
MRTRSYAGGRAIDLPWVRTLGSGHRQFCCVRIAGRCTLAYLERELDDAEAERLGFLIADAKSLIEGPIDSAMKWVPRGSDGGGPAAGYERETRVHGQLKVESHLYRWLDPERCDGTVCNVEGGLTEQSLCPDSYLMMHVSGSFETLDGALSVRFAKQAANLRRPAQADDLVVAASADLREARGTLTIDPGVPVAHVGRVYLSLQFADSQHRAYGVLAIGVFPDWDNLTDSERSMVDRRFAYYTPIEASWGDYPFDATPTVSSEP